MRLNSHAVQVIIRRLAMKKTLAALAPPAADLIIFIVAIHAGTALSAAHIASFACATVLNYFLNVRKVVDSQGRTRDPVVYSHVLVVALAVLFVRGGVLALLIRWGLPPEGAIALAAAAAAVLSGIGNSFCLSSGPWVLGGSALWRTLAVGLIAAETFQAVIHLLNFHLRDDFSVPHVAPRLWHKPDDIEALPEFAAVSEELQVFA